MQWLAASPPALVTQVGFPGPANTTLCSEADSVRTCADRFGLCCLMIPGLSKDIRCHV